MGRGNENNHLGLHQCLLDYTDHRVVDPGVLDDISFGKMRETEGGGGVLVV